MKNSVKGLIAGVSALAVLGGVWVLLRLTEPETEPEESSVATETVSLWNVDSESINKVTVSNPKGDSYVANRKIEEQASTDADGVATMVEVANYYLAGYEDIPMSTVSIRLLATRSATVSSVKTVQTNTPEADLAKYGLDTPVRVTYSVDDVEDITFLIGDETPLSGYTYLCMDGSDTVYTVSTSNTEPFLSKIVDYLGTEVTKAQADDDETTVESVRIERSDLDYDFLFRHDDFYDKVTNSGSSATDVMVEPIPCLLNVEKSAPATHGLFGLKATEVVYPHPTAAQKTECGIVDDNPFVRVTMKTSDGKTTVFRMGKQYQKKADDADEKSEGTTCYYGYLDGIDCIYGFSADDVVYEDLTPQAVASKIVFDTYVWDIGSLVYRAGDTTLSFEGMGTSKEDFVLTCNGQHSDPERFRLLYTYLLKTAAEDLVLEDVPLSGEPMVEIQLKRQDGLRENKVAFYDAGGMKAYIVVDGVARYKCRKAYVDTLLANLDIYDTDTAFTMSW